MNNFLEGLLPIVAVVMALGVPLYAIYLGMIALKCRHRERLEMIKQGIVPSLRAITKPAPNKFRSLRNGLLCLGIGVGAIVGLIVNLTMKFPHINDDLCALGGSIFVCLGIAFLIYFFVMRNKTEEDDNE